MCTSLETSYLSPDLIASLVVNGVSRARFVQIQSYATRRITPEKAVPGGQTGASELPVSTGE